MQVPLGPLQASLTVFCKESVCDCCVSNSGFATGNDSDCGTVSLSK